MNGLLLSLVNVGIVGVGPALGAATFTGLPGTPSQYGRACAGKTYTGTEPYPEFTTVGTLDACFPKYMPCQELPDEAMQTACATQMSRQGLDQVRDDVVHKLEELYAGTGTPGAQPLCDPGDDRWFRWDTLDLPNRNFPGDSDTYNLWLPFLGRPENRNFDWPLRSPPGMMTRDAYKPGSPAYAHNAELRTMGLLDGYSDLPLLDYLFRDISSPSAQLTRGRKDCLSEPASARYDLTYGDEDTSGRQPGYASLSLSDDDINIDFSGNNGKLEMGAVRGLFLRAIRYALRDIYLEIRLQFATPVSMGITLTGPGCFELAKQSVTIVRDALLTACPTCTQSPDGRVTGWTSAARERMACTNAADTTQAAGCALQAVMQLAATGTAQTIAECELFYRATEAYKWITTHDPAEFNYTAGSIRELVNKRIQNVGTNTDVLLSNDTEWGNDLRSTSPLRACYWSEEQNDASEGGYPSTFNDAACEGGNGARFDTDEDGSFRIDNKTYCCADSGQELKKVSQAYQARVQEVIFRDMVRTLRSKFRFLEIYTDPSSSLSEVKAALDGSGAATGSRFFNDDLIK